MWIYSIGKGELCHDGVFVGTGYSGYGNFKNDPKAQDKRDLGPIPEGLYFIGAAHDHRGPQYQKQLGPCVMQLFPDKDTNTYGRDAFFIHGDNQNHEASHGCIILGPLIRTHIMENGGPTGDDKLTVIA